MTNPHIGPMRRFSWLDFKVAFRMLARYPGITVIGTVAIAVAIALGTIYLEAVDKWRNPRLPVPGADRVVSIRNWDAESLRTEDRMLHDFAIWRDQVRTVEHLGAAIEFVRNLATEDKPAEPVRGVETTANAFALMGTAPLLGRALLERDEDRGEPPVVVISHTLWRTRFDSDPAVIGRVMKLGTVDATIVGVMPEGFGFPLNERIWAPLREDGALFAPRTGPGVTIFGRLAPGATMDAAQAELSGIGARVAAEYPATHEHLTPRVTGYAKPLFGGERAFILRAMLSVVAGIVVALLTVVCMNVATLVFARTATRGWEIAVRSALGASRGRIITQLFIEALVLAVLAAVAGLIVAKLAISYGLTMIGDDVLPFWIDDSLSWRTVVYTTMLALFGAAIVGVLPALRATRLNVNEALRSEGAGRAGLKFGGFWTTVIVVQVAITVALLPLAGAGVMQSNRFMQRADGIGADRYLTASVGIDRENYTMDADAFAARARASLDELERRLRAEPGVEQVTFADRLPVMDQFKYRIEVDEPTGATPVNALRTSTLVQVSRGFFPAFGSSVVAGRDFASVDFENGTTMIVNESFARYVFGGSNAIGRRVRIVSGEIESLAGEQWYEIIGVVRDFGWQLPEPHEQSAMYRPRLPSASAGLMLAVRVADPTSDPTLFATRMRTIAADVDPTIRLTDVQPLTRVGGGEAELNWVLTSVAWLVGFIVLLLSAMGIHALMSFTVARRTREIGIRAALGARPAGIVAGVFWRAFLQISTGVLAGSALAALLGLRSTTEIMLVLGADVIMLVIGVAACALPLRRALAIDPTEALRAEV